MNRVVYVGWDPREAAAYAVARHSAKKHMLTPIPVRGVVLDRLREDGLYTRPTAVRGTRLWDVISDAPMSTEFAISRFLVKWLATRDFGVNTWALFMDCDMLVRAPLERLFDACDPTKAVMCVKHVHEPCPGSVKMDGQEQLRYARKNWSSVMAINCAHPANRGLTIEHINTVPGRDLHRFDWLEPHGGEDLIGGLDEAWNYLVGHSKGIEPNIIHYTHGGPWFPAYRDCEYADAWLAALNEWAGA